MNSLEFHSCYFDQCFLDILGEKIMYMEEVNNLTESTTHKLCSVWEPRPQPLLAEPRSISKPSIKEASKVELKPFPINLKCAYLDVNETLSVIIVANLTTSHEETLLVVLRDDKESIGWTITYQGD